MFVQLDVNVLKTARSLNAGIKKPREIFHGVWLANTIKL